MGETVDELIRDIFAATGQKVSPDDPIVSAALVNSRLLRAAGADAAKELRDAVAAAAEVLANAARAHDAAKDHAHEAAQRAANLVESAAGSAADSAADLVTQQVESVAKTAIREALATGEARAPQAWKLKVAIVGASFGLACIVAGGLAGAWIAHSSKLELNEQQQRELAAGKDFIAILPLMDQATKARVVKLIKDAGRNG